MRTYHKKHLDGDRFSYSVKEHDLFPTRQSEVTESLSFLLSVEVNSLSLSTKGVFGNSGEDNPISEHSLPKILPVGFSILP